MNTVGKKENNFSTIIERKYKVQITKVLYRLGQINNQDLEAYLVYRAGVLCNNITYSKNIDAILYAHFLRNAKCFMRNSTKTKNRFTSIDEDYQDRRHESKVVDLLVSIEQTLSPAELKTFQECYNNSKPMPVWIKEKLEHLR